jgi:hypothetical protein
MVYKPGFGKFQAFLENNPNLEDSLHTIESARDSKLPTVKKKTLKRVNYSLKQFKRNKVTPQFIKNTSLRLHLSTKNKVKSSIFGAVTTPSSLRLTNLQTRYEELQKIADKNHFGNIKIPENRLLKLTFCDYRGHGKFKKDRMHQYMRDRKSMNQSLGLRERKFKQLKEEEIIDQNGVSTIGVKLALDIDKYMEQDRLKLENSVMKVEKKKNAKRERENIEKNNKEYEDFLIYHNKDLA